MQSWHISLPCLCFATNMEANGTRDVEIQQFAKKVYHFSSQYGGETSISYTVTNLAGMCTKYPHYGDFTQACVFVSNKSRLQSLTHLLTTQSTVAACLRFSF